MFFFEQQHVTAVLTARRGSCPYLNSDCASSQQVCFAVFRLHMCGPVGSGVCSHMSAFMCHWVTGHMRPLGCLCLLWIRPNCLVLWTLVPQVGHVCAKRLVGCVGRRSPSSTRNCFPHTRRWSTFPDTMEVVTKPWQKGHAYT